MFDVNDIIGKKFNKLTVLEYSHKKPKNSKNSFRYYYKVQCDCGTIKIVGRSELIYGKTKSCGCLQHVKKGFGKTRIHNIWSHMKQRCLNPNLPKFKNYGGRGITVCDEWKNDFKAFYDWGMANGYQDDLTIDRIDVNGNYEPANCRWATNKEQAVNKTTTHLITYMNKTQPLKVWCEELSLNYSAIENRINKRGWDIKKAFETPLIINKKFVTYKGRKQRLCSWIRELNLNKGTVSSRLQRGWSVERAFETP